MLLDKCHAPIFKQKQFLRTNFRLVAKIEVKGSESSIVERDVRDVHSKLVATFLRAPSYSSMLLFVER